MNTENTNGSQVAWARITGKEIARHAWAQGMSLTRMADKLNERLARYDGDLVDTAMDAALEWWENEAATAEDRRDEAIDGIAQRILDVADVATAGIEDQDSVDVARGDLAEALRAAYAAGLAAGRAEVK